MPARLPILAHLLLTCFISLVCQKSLIQERYATAEQNESVTFIVAQLVSKCQGVANGEACTR